MKLFYLLFPIYLGLVSCVPYPYKDYYKPHYPSAEYKAGQCNSGPEEFVIINTYDNVRVQLKAIKNKKGVEIFLYVKLPDLIQANFTKNTFELKTSNNTYNYSAKSLSRSNMADKKFTDQLTGLEISEHKALFNITKTYEIPYTTRFIIETKSENDFSLLLPPLNVYNKVYKFQPITFKYTTTGWGISPINC